MRTRYEVRSGKRTVSLQWASTAQEAVIEYLRSSGVRREEIARLGMSAASWRGAVYSAVPVEPNA